MISVSVDLIEHGIYNHGQRVAYVAYKIYKGLFPKGDAFPIVIASFLHDIGIDTDEVRTKARNFIVEENALSKHSKVGAMLLDKVDLLKTIKPFIRYHHTSYADTLGEIRDLVPIEAQIINLADRIEILIDPNQYILAQKNRIRDRIKNYSGTMFNPKIVDEFMKLSKKESFWLDINNEYMQVGLWEVSFGRQSIAYEKDILQFAQLCAEVVDRKSPFTHAHSKRVASIAKKIGEKFYMSDGDLFLLEIAGELHDIGKLSIPSSILHKEGKLTEDEYRIIRQHTYHSYYLIDRLNLSNKVRDWAAFHHEKLDGSGYPFHLKASGLDLGARIMTLADMVTALSEDRPYRKQLPKGEILDILWNQVKDNKIDGDVVNVLEKNYEYIIF